MRPQEGNSFLRGITNQLVVAKIKGAKGFPDLIDKGMK
jgi:hypothetical protein